MSDAKEFIGKFELDVPAGMQDDLITRIVEVAWGGATDPDISIIDLDKHNALNISFTGSVMIDGREHYFVMRDGDWNGTEIIAWNEDKGLERQEPVIWTVAPTLGRINGLSGPHEAQQLLNEWMDALNPATLLGKDLHDRGAKRAYDAYVAPGTGTTAQHDKIAASHGYEIVDQESALLRRKAAVAHFYVVSCIMASEVRDVPAMLSMLADSRDPATEIGQLSAEILDKLSTELAKTPEGWMMGVGAKIAEPLLAHGLCVKRPIAAMIDRTGLLSRQFTLRAIEGFDATTLPSNPVAELFMRLDPSLVRDTRVDPALEATNVLGHATVNAARVWAREIPDSVNDRLSVYGYELVRIGGPNAVMSAEDEPSPDF